ncbi:MAG: glutamine-hydrolyzing GMP synthase, partial [Candidatus Thorarchaeota archaeon]
MIISERILVIDYGGQYTHLISRKCRELGVYAEIVPYDLKFDQHSFYGIKGVILSGGPRTVTSSDLDTTFKENFANLSMLGIKILGICFGHQLLAVHLGAKLSARGNPEYGQMEIEVVERGKLFKGFDEKQTVWMSHNDEVIELPEGMKALATSGNNRIAAFCDNSDSIFGVQFHPEVTHTPNGLTILEAFLRDICMYQDFWNPEDQVDDILLYVKNTVGNSRVLMGTSGGVDSTVAAFLIREAIGKRLFCVFVDNGLLREGEKEEVIKSFSEIGFENFAAIDASDEFIDALEGIEDPEEKRAVIADKFIEVFERTANDLESKYGEFEFLG